MEWAGPTESFGGAGRGRERSRSCDLCKKKKHQGACFLSPEAQQEGEGEPHARVPLADAGNARQSICQQVLSRGEASFGAGSRCGSMLVPYPPFSRRKEGAFSTHGLISMPCGAGLMPATH